MTTTTETVAQRAGRREWIGLAALALACLLYVMDLTVLHLAVPSITAEMKPSSSQMLWMIDIYGFFVAGALVTMGTLGDRVGRRRMLLIGAAAFGVISIVTAFSVNPTMLIICRALLGIAGATLAPSTLSLIFHMFQDPKQRSVAIGVWIGAFSAGAAVGPVLGGVLLELFWWGSVFLLAVPVMFALLVLGPRVLPEYRDESAGRLDLPSVVLSIAAVLAVIYGFKGIAQDGLRIASVAAIAIGVALGVLWVRRQRRIPDPMIDISLFRIRAFNAALSVNFLAIFVAIGYFLFVAQYLQLVVGLSPLEAGLWSLPSALGFVAGSQITPRISGRVGPRNLIAGGLAIAAVGMAMLTQVSGTTGLPLLVTASLVISLGFAPVFGLTTELIVGSAPPERAGAASGISETGAELGGALGIAVLGSVGVAVYRGQLSDSLPTSTPADVVDTASDTLGAAIGAAGELPAPLGAQVIDAAQTAFVNGMHVVAAVGTVLAVAVAAVAWHALRAHGSTTSPDEQIEAVALEPVADPVG
jgi:DHA2 family multidrug resistance protein-like MFS transporter